MIFHFNNSRSNWPHSVTGIWGDAKSKEANEAHVGYLVLFEEGGQAIGVSTTMSSVWTGEFRDGNLLADYINKHHVIGKVWLKLSPDGASLSDEWWTEEQKRQGGVYAAYRSTQISKSLLFEHICQRFGAGILVVA